MQTVYDWLTLALFAALIVLFVQRSMNRGMTVSPLHYLIAGAGCALVNYLGNEGMHLAGLLTLAGVIAYSQLTLDPLSLRSGPD
jgi:hypothetical protein